MLIGITGPVGAGKDTTAEYLSQRLQIQHLSGGDFLRNTLRSQGIEPTKESIKDLGISLRKEHGPEAIVHALLDKAEDTKGLIISGFRAPSEAEAIQKRGGYILYVNANSTERHQRVVERGRTGDVLDREQLKELDKREGTAHKDEENLEIIKDTANAIIENDGSKEDLYAKLDELSAKLLQPAPEWS